MMGGGRTFRGWRRTAGDVVAYAFLGLMSAVALFPLVWGFLSSLKDERLMFSYPPRLLPDPLTFVHYRGVLFDTNMPLFFWNSLLVTCATVGLTVLVAFHGAYAAARFDFKGREVLLFVILSTAMIPGIAILVPLYLLARRVGIFDTHVGLVLVYSAWQMPMTLWLLRGFIEAVPRELEEAAALDGCSRSGLMWRIMLPLIRPGLLAAGIMVFVYVWNDFLIAVTLTNSEVKRLLQVGLYRYYADTTGIFWGRFMAYTTLSSLPILAAFFALNRRFIQGMTEGGLKG